MSSMYTLTRMTGREASATRTVVIGTVEFNWRVWIILMASSPVGLILVAIFWILLHSASLIFLPITWGAAIWLFHRRTSDGLRLQTYRAMWDKKKAATNQFFLCGVPLDVTHTDYRSVTANSVLYAPTPPASSVSLVDSLRPFDAETPQPTSATFERPVPKQVWQETPEPKAVIAPPIFSPISSMRSDVAPAQMTHVVPATPVAPPVPAAPSVFERVAPLDHLDASMIGVERDPTPDVSRFFNDQRQDRTR